MSKTKRYDLAISFAGEDRKVAREIAEALTIVGYEVFFDEFERAGLWGEDLSVKLEQIYSAAARYCLILVSAAYAKKPWTTHERRSAMSRAMTKRTAYVLPLRLDDTKLPGFPEVIGYLDLRTISVREVIDLLQAKIGTPLARSLRGGRQRKPSPDQIRQVLAVCYRRAIFARMHAQVSEPAMLASMAECRKELQKLIVFIEPELFQGLVASIIGELDFIERLHHNVHDYTRSNPETNAAKLRIIAALNELALKARVSFVLPSSVTEEVFLRKEDADSPPEDQREWGGREQFHLSTPNSIWRYPR